MIDEQEIDRRSVRVREWRVIEGVNTPINPQLCHANTKSCSPRTGGCGYRYPKGYKRWQEGGCCPKCGRHRRCTRNHIAGKRMCTIHGGGTPKKGRLTGNPAKTKLARLTDLYKKALPPGMLPGFEAALTDPDRLTFKHSLAIQDELIRERLRRIDSLESDSAWDILREERAKYIGAVRARERNPHDDEAARQIADSISRIIYVIGNGADSNATKRELENSLQQQRKLITAEYDRLKTMGEMVKLEQYLAFIELCGYEMIQTINDFPHLPEDIKPEIKRTLRNRLEYQMKKQDIEAEKLLAIEGVASPPEM